MGYTPPGAASRIAQRCLVCAALLVSLVPASRAGLLGSANSDNQLLYAQLSNIFAVAGNAVFYFRTLKNTRSLTSSAVAPLWTTAIVAFGPIAAVLVILSFILFSTMPYLHDKIGSAGIGLAAAGLYVGWIISSCLWPWLWVRLVEQLETKAGIVKYLQLKIWAAFWIAAAAFVWMVADRFLGPITAELLGFAISLASLFVVSQITQDISILQQTIRASADGENCQPHAPARKLINLSKSVLRIMIAFGIASFLSILLIDLLKLLTPSLNTPLFF